MAEKTKKTETEEVEVSEEKTEAKAKETNDAQVSPKSRLVALVVCFFFGWAGGHRFYTNKVGTGILMLFTMGGFGIWYFLDLVMIAMGAFKDKENLVLSKWNIS